MPDGAIKHYTAQLAVYMDGDNWVDETFSKKLEVVDESNAFKRPLPDVHSVAEIVSHLLEWRVCILSLLKGGTRTLREADPRNWLGNEELQPKGWKSLRDAFYKSQDDIIALLNEKDDSFLDQMARGETHDLRYYVNGLLEHDMYHLGQLGLIIKLLRR